MKASTKVGRAKIGAALESIARAAGATRVEFEEEGREARFSADFPAVSVSCDVDTLFPGLMFHWHSATRDLCPHFADSVNRYHWRKATLNPREDVAESIEAFRECCEEVGNGCAFADEVSA